MKKLFALVFVSAWICLFSVPCTASYFIIDAEEEEKPETQDYDSGFADALPEELRDSLGGIFEPEGDTADPWTSAAEAALEALGESLSPAFAGLCTLTGVIILAAVCKCLNINVADGEQAKAFSYLVRAVLALIVLKTQIDVLSGLETFSSRICTTVTGFIPAVSAVYLASGNVTLAALTQSGFAMLTALAENTFSYIVLPAVKAVFALTAVSCVTGQSAPGALAVFVRNAAAFICTASMTVLSFVLAMRMKIGDAADSAVMKTVQFAAGSFIPIVGGAISDSVGQVGASMALIKASCGSAAAAALIILVLPTLVSLALNRAVLFISKHICAALSLTEEEKLFSGLGSGATLAIAYAVSVTVMFVICMALFVKSGSAVS